MDRKKLRCYVAEFLMLAYVVGYISIQVRVVWKFIESLCVCMDSYAAIVPQRSVNRWV